MSDTPRTMIQDRIESLVHAFDDEGRKYAVRLLAKDVGNLERELAAANRKIQRLVEAGNALRNALHGCWNGTFRTTDTQANGAMVQWNTAKEEKPS